MKISIFRHRFLYFIFAASVFLNPLVSKAASGITEQSIAAETGLASLLKGDFANRRLGIPGSTAAVATTTIGLGFRIYTIKPDDLVSTKSNDISSLLIPTNLWEFIVMNQGQAKALLAVDNVGQGWKAVSIGSAELAAELLRVSNSWPESSGYKLTLVRVYQAFSELMVLSGPNGIIGVIPLVSARVAQGKSAISFNPLAYDSQNDTIVKLKEIVKRTVQ